MTGNSTHHFSYLRRLIKMLRKAAWRINKENIFTDAGSLTFSSMTALVPLVTVVLSVFSVLPAFSQMQAELENWFVKSLIPENIGKQVFEYVNQFSEQASNLGLISGIFLFISSILLLSSINNAFNKIWHTKTYRSVAQKIFIYWSCITLFPIILALGITINSYIIYASSTLLHDQQNNLISLATLLEAALFLAASTMMFYLLPEAKVKLTHALTGGILVTLIIGLVKKLWLIYYAMVPTYSVVYGAFVIVPLLILWVYVLWIIVLTVAVIVSMLPDLNTTDATIAHGTKGWKFKLACHILTLLNHGINGNKALNIEQIAAVMTTNTVYVRDILTVLAKFGWVSKIANSQQKEAYILNIDCSKTAIRPLLNKYVISDQKLLAKLLTAHPEPTVADFLTDNL